MQIKKCPQFSITLFASMCIPWKCWKLIALSFVCLHCWSCTQFEQSYCKSLVRANVMILATTNICFPPQKTMLIRFVQGIARSLFVVWRKMTTQEIQKLCPVIPYWSGLDDFQDCPKDPEFSNSLRDIFQILCLCVSVSLCLPVSLFLCLSCLWNIFVSCLSWCIFVLMLVVCEFFSLWKSHTGI